MELIKDGLGLFTKELENLENQEKYKKYLNGNVTNSFTAINKKSLSKYYPEGQQLLFEPKELGLDSVELTEYKENSNYNLSVTSSKLLDIIQLTLTELLPYKATPEELSKYRILELDVKKYMELTGQKSKNDAVKQLKKDLETLFKARVKATILRNVKKGKTYIKEPIKMDLRFIDAKPAGAIRQTAIISLSISYLEYLSQYTQIMDYPLPILISSKNSNAYYLGKKLSAHYNMNRNKTNKNSISVNNLLKYTPDIPTLDEEKQRGRHYRERCIEPLEKTLDELQTLEVIKEWYFCNEKKQPLTLTQLIQWATTYEEWKKIYIYFSLKDYPNFLQAPKK